MTDLDEWNKLAADFIIEKKNKKGTYKKLQKTKIWANAKKVLMDMEAKNGKIICHHCKRPILLSKENPTLHHKKYAWNDLFNPRNVEFLHFNCHQRVHKIKNAYRRRKRK